MKKEEQKYDVKNLYAGRLYQVTEINKNKNQISYTIKAQPNIYIFQIKDNIISQISNQKNYNFAHKDIKIDEFILKQNKLIPLKQIYNNRKSTDAIYLSHKSICKIEEMLNENQEVKKEITLT